MRQSWEKFRNSVANAVHGNEIMREKGRDGPTDGHVQMCVRRVGMDPQMGMCRCAWRPGEDAKHWALRSHHTLRFFETGPFTESVLTQWISTFLIQRPVGTAPHAAVTLCCGGNLTLIAPS